MPAVARDILERHDRMKAERAIWETDWQTLGEYCALLKQVALTGAVPGSKITGKVFDSLSFMAPQILASSLHANLTNPSTRWQRITVRQADLREDDAVQDWLDDTSLRQARARAASNFTNAAGEVYLELPVFGTGAMRIDELPPVRRQDGSTFSGFRYRTAPIGTYWIAEGPLGIVDTLFCETQLSARQAYGNWGKKIGDTLGKKYENEKTRDEMVTIVEACYPRTDRLPERGGPLNMPWVYAAVYPEGSGGGHLIHEGGYNEFPWVSPRWLKGTYEVWGRGQGHLALPDIRTLNRITELKLLGVAMDIAPALFERENAVRGALVWEPAARNVVRDKDSVWTMPSGARIDIAILQEDRIEQKIRQVFFVDQILALPAPADDKIGGMSPFEVSRRIEQVFRILGPVYGRLESEWLQPLTARELALMYRGGALAPLPPALASRPDAELDFQFEGPMSRAQRADEAAGIEQTLLFTQQLALATQDMSPFDNFDLDQAAQTYAEIKGLPAKIQRGRDVVEQLRAQRAQQLAQAQQAQAALTTTEAMKNAAPMVKALQPAGSA